MHGQRNDVSFIPMQFFNPLSLGSHHVENEAFERLQAYTELSVPQTCLGVFSMHM